MNTSVLDLLPGTRLQRTATSKMLAALTTWPAQQVVVTVPFCDDGGCYLAALPADRPLSLARIRDALRSPRLHRASLQEALRALPGIAPAAIPPFGELLGIPVVADARLLTQGKLVCGSGVEGGSLMIDADDLLRIGGAQVADLGAERVTSSG